MRTASPRLLWTALIFYIAVSLGYQIVASVSLIVGYFNLRRQVDQPFDPGYTHRRISSVSPLASKAGLQVGDTLETLNGVPFAGRAQWQEARFFAHPGDRWHVRVRKPSGQELDFTIPLEPELETFSWGEAIFLLVVQLLVPLICLALGYWVALARPADPNAWFILILLSFPEAFISISTYNWLPGPWLVLRLFWQTALQVLAPAAMLWLGLLFLERSRIDVRAPWLKWVVLAVQLAGLGIEFAAQYSGWYDQSFFVNRQAIESFTDSTLNWMTLLCIAVYWFTLFEKLTTAATPDAKRRLRVLTAGSTVGLASTLIVWGLLPRFGIDPGAVPGLVYLGAILLLTFPFSLAYVVIVQRAMDVRLLIRLGTRYAAARTTLIFLEVTVASILFFRFILPALQQKRQGLLLIVPILAVAVLILLFAVRKAVSNRIQQWLDRRFFREAYNAELVLSDLAQRARSMTDPGTLIDTVSSRISEVLHVPRVVVLLRDMQTFRLGHELGAHLDASLELPEDSAPVRHLTSTVSPAVLYLENPDRWFLDSDRAQQEALSRIGAELLLPLAGRSRLMGIMALGPKQSEEPYSPSDLRLLASVGAQTGLGLEIGDLARCLAAEAEQHQRIQRDVEIAHEVQERLFPQTFPATPGIELAGHCRPALGIGGDYYDVFELPDGPLGGRLGLAIGDVSGKGIPAALLMASLRASLRGLADDHAHDLARMMRRLNSLIYDSSAVNRYATFFFAIYEPRSRELRYVNAGHNPIFVLRASGQTLRLEDGGPVIGLLRDVTYESHGVQLQPGDVLLAYTDGISEAMTADDEEWGEGRMLDAARSLTGLGAPTMLRELFLSADRFTGGAAQHDDMTILLMKLT